MASSFLGAAGGAFAGADFKTALEFFAGGGGTLGGGGLIDGGATMLPPGGGGGGAAIFGGGGGGPPFTTGAVAVAFAGVGGAGGADIFVAFLGASYTGALTAT